MRDMLTSFLLCFVPAFIAVDAIGVLPMFARLTQGVDPPRAHRIIRQSIVTATAVALAFLAAGSAVFRLLGITVADFMIAGGLLLLIISVSDLLSAEKRQRRVDPESLGVVPLGVPLITGPAVLTTSLLLLNQHGIISTTAAIVVNILIGGLVFWSADRLQRWLGRTGATALSKIASLLLAAIGVMMIRRGVVAVVSTMASPDGVVP